MRMRRSSVRAPVLADSRRIELVPQSMAATGAAEPVTGVVGRRSRRILTGASTGISSRSRSSVVDPRPTGSSPPARTSALVRVQALHALAGAADPADGRGPDVTGGHGRVPLGGVGGVGGGAARRDRLSASAWRTPPLDSRVPMAERRSGSHEPVAGGHRACRRAGAARCASPRGHPWRERTTTSNRPIGDRPSSSATRARSSAAGGHLRRRRTRHRTKHGDGHAEQRARPASARATGAARAGRWPRARACRSCGRPARP